MTALDVRLRRLTQRLIPPPEDPLTAAAAEAAAEFGLSVEEILAEVRLMEDEAEAAGLSMPAYLAQQEATFAEADPQRGLTQ